MDLKILLFLCCFVLNTFAEKVQVQLKNGPIIGETIIAEHRPLNRFLGIPYAKAPVGKLRFRKPVPLDKWTKPIESLNWPVNCISIDSIFPVLVESNKLKTNSNHSEDCLFLNIWSPNVTEKQNLRPVLVWIHGGGFYIGGSPSQLFDGETISSHADAVFVSFNYRLSTLGFLYSDEVADIKGNQALWDQALALQWIHENIQHFGGDPNAITLMGQSAGATSVSMHILSPITRNLFRNAIMMSGSAFVPTMVEEPVSHVAKFLTGIRQVGCATPQDHKITAKVVECLEKLDTQKVDLIFLLSINTTTHEKVALPVIDGHFLPEHPQAMFAKQNVKQNLNLLVSTVEDEGSFMLNLMDKQFAQANPEPITLKEAQQFVIDKLENSFLHQKQLPNSTITRVYFNGLNEHHDSEDLFRKRASIALGDYFLTCPVIDFAKNMFRLNQTKVYQWYYTAQLGQPKMASSTWSGTAHTDDIYPALGLPFRTPENFLNRERDISTEIMNFISSFIRTGNPGRDETEWQPYFLAEDGQELIAPYYHIGNEYKTADSFKLNLKKFECDYIWNRYYRKN